MPTLLPEATITILDGQLGAVSPNTAQATCAIGACSIGTPGTFYSHATSSQLVTDLGQGPLVEARAQVINVAGGSGGVYSVPATPSTFGGSAPTVALASAGTYSGTTTHTGTGAGSVAVSIAPDRRIDAKIMLGGALGTAQVAFSVAGGPWSNPVTTAAGPWTYQVPGTLCKLTFAAATYVLNDVFTVSTAGVVTVVGTGPAGNVTQVSSPLDHYQVLVSVVSPGALGVATFTWSPDNGVTPSGVINVPTAGVYVLPGTGLVLTFSGTFVALDTYFAATTSPAVTTSDLMLGVDAATANPLTWGVLHLAATPATAAAAATLAAATDTKMTAMAAAYRYAVAVVHCPQDADIGGSNTDSALQTAFANWSSTRVIVMAGDCKLSSALRTRQMRRNIGYPVVARIASITASVDAAEVGIPANPLKNVTGIYRDEGVTPFLDALGFLTLRTMTGLNVGYFITRARTFAPAGSDFISIANRRVMDIVSSAVRARAVGYVNKRIATDATGKIKEGTALRIEQDIENYVRNQCGTEFVDVIVKVTRNANILATSTLLIEIYVQPFAYSQYVAVTLGFYNPALGA